jgi:hypothetical protein
MNNNLISALLERYNKYRKAGFSKEQIFKMLNKTEFALLAFYFIEKEEETRQKLSTSK